MEVSTFEEKVNEYIKKVKELNRNLNSSDNIKFSDGTDMFKWYCKQSTIIRQSDVIKIPTKERLQEIKLYAQIDNIIYEINKTKEQKRALTYEEKVNEYINKVLELRRNISKKDNYKFKDKTNMLTWYNNQFAKFSKYVKKGKKPPKYIIQKMILYAQIDNVLYDLKKEDEEKSKKLTNENK